MKTTFHAVLNRLSTKSPHAVLLGRKTRHEISDLTDKGCEMMDKAEIGGEDVLDEVNIDSEAGSIALEDVVVELLS